MPIRFSCTSCGQAMIAPQQSAAREATCRRCGTLVPIPLGEPTGSGILADQAYTQPAGATDKLGGVTSAEEAAANPFESPRVGGREATSGAAPPPRDGIILADIEPTVIEYDDVLGSSWTLFRARLEDVAIAAIPSILMPVLEYSGVATMEVAVTALYVDESGGREWFGAEVQAENAAAFFASGLIAFVASIWLRVGLLRYFLKVARNRQTTLYDLLLSSGRYMVRASMLSVVMLAISYVYLVPVVILLPDPVGVYGLRFLFSLLYLFAFLYLSQCLPLVVDRNQSCWLAIRTSIGVMRGNKGTLFVLFVIPSILFAVTVVAAIALNTVAIFRILQLITGVVALFGTVLYLPFMALLTCVFFLKITGQDTGDLPSVRW